MGHWTPVVLFKPPATSSHTEAPFRRPESWHPSDAWPDWTTQPRPLRGEAGPGPPAPRKKPWMSNHTTRHDTTRHDAKRHGTVPHGQFARVQVTAFVDSVQPTWSPSKFINIAVKPIYEDVPQSWPSDRFMVVYPGPGVNLVSRSPGVLVAHGSSPRARCGRILVSSILHSSPAAA